MKTRLNSRLANRAAAVFLSVVTGPLSLAAPVGSAPAVSAPGACRKNIVPGFELVKSEKDMDSYVSKSMGLALTVKCESPAFQLSDLHRLIEPTFTLVKGANRTFYFDFNGAGVYGRTYYVPGKPVVQLSFVSDEKNKAALESTKTIVAELRLEP